MIKTLTLMLMFAGSTASAFTLKDVQRANCEAQSGSYFEIDLKNQSIAAKFAGLPQLTNVYDGEKMPVEFQEEDGHTFLLGLVVDRSGAIFGSAGLAAITDQNLGSTTELTAVFREMTGLVKTEKMMCSLK